MEPRIRSSIRLARALVLLVGTSLPMFPTDSLAAAPTASERSRWWTYLGGAAGEDTDAIKFGVRFDTPRTHALFGFVVDVHLELELGRWRASRPASAVESPQVDQYSVVPVLRLRRTPGSRRYVEVGIGPSWITPLYRDESRRFSTRFQFRDHIAVGWSFGSGGRHEIGLHAEHFSNASMDSPNPGVNLFGARYALSF